MEFNNLDSLFQRIQSSEISVGHSYNLIDTRWRKILNVETASRNRVSVCEVGGSPFFHANVYLHLQIEQVNTSTLKKLASILSSTFSWIKATLFMTLEIEQDAKPVIMQSLKRYPFWGGESQLINMKQKRGGFFTKCKLIRQFNKYFSASYFQQVKSLVSC